MIRYNDKMESHLLKHGLKKLPTSGWSLFLLRKFTENDSLRPWIHPDVILAVMRGIECQYKKEERELLFVPSESERCIIRLTGIPEVFMLQNAQHGLSISGTVTDYRGNGDFRTMRKYLVVGDQVIFFPFGFVVSDGVWKINRRG